MNSIKKIFCSIPVSIWLVSLMTILAATAGCASHDKRDPRPPKLSLPEFESDGMTRKVALGLFDNRTQLRFEEVEQSFYKPLNEQVTKQCSSIKLYTPYAAGFTQALAEATLATGKRGVDNMALAKTGRALGLNAVVTGRIENISGFEREKGFWFLKENQHYQRILLHMDMYDIETGAKYLSEAYSEELEISDAEFNALANGTVANSPIIMEAFEQLAEDIAEDICDLLDDIPWVGFVTGVDNGFVTLSSGADVGLKPGSRLELYNSNTILKSRNGSQFFVPGLKTGEIEITTVSADTARARLQPDATAEPGYAVRFR